MTVCLLLFLSTAFGEERTLEFAKEKEKFDEHKEKPSDLIERFYTKSQILLLGAANHRNYQHHEYLLELLKKFGADESLRFIVLEQFHDNAEFYRQLSIKPLREVLNEFDFRDNHKRAITLCWSREWSYVYTHVFPVIQEINRRRKIPLVVVAVDGFSSSLPVNLPRKAEVQSNDCTFEDPAYWTDMVHSRDREEATAKNFYVDVWSQLKPGQKAIVLYHQQHLYRGFESCGVVTRNGRFVSEIGPMNWFTAFLQAHPEAGPAMRLIVFDELDEAHHHHGVLRFAKRQAARHPGEAWAFDTEHLAGLDLERGENAWLFSRVFNNTNEGMNHSDQYFYKMVDGIVFSPKAHVDKKLKPIIADYLPGICSPPNYDGNTLWHPEK